MPQVPQAFPTGLADPGAVERTREQLRCMEMEQKVAALFASLTSNRPPEPPPHVLAFGQQGAGQQGTGARLPETPPRPDYTQVMMEIEMNPDLLEKCPRLRYWLERLKRAKEMADRAAMLQEWEQRYGVPQLPSPPGGGTP
jgi:hypothetical protein